MKIRIYHGDRVKDIDNAPDDTTTIERVLIGERIINMIGTGEHEVAYRRTDEVEDGRVVFR